MTENGLISHLLSLKVRTNERDVNSFTITPRVQPKLDNTIVNFQLTLNPYGRGNQ